MSKLDRVALYAIKEYAKEQERKRKAAEKEELRKEKEHLKQEEIAQRYREYEAWKQEEDRWLKIFDGTLRPKIKWEEKLAPRPYQEPEPPKTEHLTKQAIDLVKAKYKNRLSIITISMGIFFGIAVTSTDNQETTIAGIIGMVLLFWVMWIWRKRKKELLFVLEKANAEKANLEREYQRNGKSPKHYLNKRNRSVLIRLRPF